MVFFHASNLPKSCLPSPNLQHTNLHPSIQVANCAYGIILGPIGPCLTCAVCGPNGPAGSRPLALYGPIRHPRSHHHQSAAPGPWLCPTCNNRGPDLAPMPCVRAQATRATCVASAALATAPSGAGPAHGGAPSLLGRVAPPPLGRAQGCCNVGPHHAPPPPLSRGAGWLHGLGNHSCSCPPGSPDHGKQLQVAGPRLLGGRRPRGGVVLCAG
jgi:hypothetical protein